MNAFWSSYHHSMVQTILFFLTCASQATPSCPERIDRSQAQRTTAAGTEVLKRITNTVDTEQSKLTVHIALLSVVTLLFRRRRDTSLVLSKRNTAQL